ncbi:phosphotransferase [Nocardioides hwasunensis]|uniref:Phosphotransferase n=1 Tax=Nocardioides hwasunensis TaxID=397258 RepID=A0ABR8MJE7_9ACTN|nr:phosphotransferase [Nocardioides hwasunensis]MBD3916112.1 phosphotransferase [Nocardioides hwasunensis]
MSRRPPIAPYPVPHDATARRLEWEFLPPNLRAWIERKCGSPVVRAISQTTGFTPGFASVLVCEDGSRHFAKAASVKAQRVFADSYREEARKLAALPASVPAPRLLWHLDDDWVVLGTEYVDGRPPQRPWQADELDAVLDALEQAAEALTPPPAGLALDTAADDFAPLLEHWAALRDHRTDLDPTHLAEAEALARRYAEVVGGDTLVHTDIRSDNVLIGADGRAVVCDWNWPVRGAAWFDSFAALIAPRGEGIDVDRVIAERRLLRDVDAEALDINLALYVGYFLTQCELPVPPTSPHIRDHQRWQGEVCWDWLAERRGWS